MKQLLFLLLAAPLFLKAQDETGIKWTTGLSWEQIKAKAKAENKYIFLDCYTTWCAPCKLMDKQVYINDTIGNLLNEKFIAVKAQFDQTVNDDANVKNWYDDVKLIGNTYFLEGYPSLLFFSPSAQLVYRKTGFRSVLAFAKDVQEAQDPKRRIIFQDLQEYRNGKKAYASMPDLVVAAKELLLNQPLADSIAKDYIVNYFNKLSETEMLTPYNLWFVQRHLNFIKSSDRFFQLLGSKSVIIDSIYNDKGHSARMVSAVVNKEEILDKIWKGGDPTQKKLKKEPNWRSIEKSIIAKYGNEYLINLQLNRVKLFFYSQSRNWKKYVTIVESALKSYPPTDDPNGSQLTKSIGAYNDAWTLNLAAWAMFQNCNDKKILIKALEWGNLSLKVGNNQKGTVFQYIDTKACLLYKLHKLFDIGKLEDAINLEREAVSLTSSFAQARQGYEMQISKMKNGEKIWK